MTALKTQIQSFLATQGVGVTVPESVYRFSNGTTLTCGTLKAYRSSEFVTQQDVAEYIIEAEHHWYVQPFMHDRGSIAHSAHGFCACEIFSPQAAYRLVDSKLYLRAKHYFRSSILCRPP